MQMIVRSKPYPSRDRTPLPSRVALVGFQALGDAQKRQTILLSEISLGTRHERQHLLNCLRNCYALPEDEGYERFAASVFLSNTHSEARTKLLAAHWIGNNLTTFDHITKQSYGPYNLETVSVSLQRRSTIDWMHFRFAMLGYLHRLFTSPFLSSFRLLSTGLTSLIWSVSRPV